MELSEKCLSSVRKFEGCNINLRVDTVELEDGSRGTREIVEHPGGVGILAVDGEDNLLMVRQHRSGAGKVMLEIPAGKLNRGEDPYTCGLRELEEETGCTAGEYTSLGLLYPTPAYCDEIIYLYLATNLGSGEQHLDEDEFLLVEKVPLKEAVQMCVDGSIEDAKTVIAILKYHAMQLGGTR